MMKNLYCKINNCFDIFQLRNYKYQTIFHIAAKYNSLESLEHLLGKNIFLQELLKRDYKGNTPLHSAFISGSLDILNFYLTRCTEKFLFFKNDDGLTPQDAMLHKLNSLHSKINNKKSQPADKEKYLQ